MLFKNNYMQTDKSIPIDINDDGTRFNIGDLIYWETKVDVNLDIFGAPDWQIIAKYGIITRISKLNKIVEQITARQLITSHPTLKHAFKEHYLSKPFNDIVIWHSTT